MAEPKKPGTKITLESSPVSDLGKFSTMCVCYNDTSKLFIELLHESVYLLFMNCLTHIILSMKWQSLAMSRKLNVAYPQGRLIFSVKYEIS